MRPVLLTMVRNEYETLDRLIRSCIEQIGRVVVVDTGSDDYARVKSIIETLQAEYGYTNVILHLYHCEWIDFATNRNQALLITKSLYPNRPILLADGDWTLEGVLPDDAAIDTMTRDGYSGVELDVTGFDVQVRHPLLVWGDEWRYTGVLHEYLAGGDKIYWADATFRAHGDGPRRTGDVDVLTKTVDRDPDDGRTRFYLAMTYFWQDDLYQAQEHFKARAEMEGYWEETWLAKVMNIRIDQLLAPGRGDVPGRYMLTASEHPDRPEPLFWTLDWLHNAGQFDLVYSIATARSRSQQRGTGLFTATWMDQWGFDWQRATAAAHLGRYDVALGLYADLLAGRVPKESPYRHMITARITWVQEQMTR